MLSLEKSLLILTPSICDKFSYWVDLITTAQDENLKKGFLHFKINSNQHLDDSTRLMLMKYLSEKGFYLERCEIKFQCYNIYPIQEKYHKFLKDFVDDYIKKEQK